jgi:hypothetical protein
VPDASGAATGGLDIWAQCGGRGGNCGQYTCVDGAYPGQTCPAGASCQRLHEWYYQCRPCKQVGSSRVKRGLLHRAAQLRALYRSRPPA